MYEMRKAIKDRNHERIFELLRDSRIASDEYILVDFGLEEGETVFRKLTERPYFSQNELIDYYISRMKDIQFNWNEVFRLEPDVDSYDSDTYYFTCGGLMSNPGILFVDNLRCSKNNPKDYEYYEKLALEIEKDRELDIEQAQWLVAYAYDPSTFPQYFLDKFEMISLDSKDYGAEEQKEKVSQKKGKKIEKRKSTEKKPRGSKKHYIAPEKRDNIIKEMIEGYPRESNVFIARKAMIEIEKDYGTKPDGKPLYTEKTLAKEVSKLKTKKKRKKNVR